MQNIPFLFRLEKTVSQFEKEHHISKRWEVTDPGYIETRALLLKEKQSQLVVSMWSFVVKRQFLLGLKGKYYAGVYMILVGSHAQISVGSLAIYIKLACKIIVHDVSRYSEGQKLQSDFQFKCLRRLKGYDTFSSTTMIPVCT